MDEDAKTAALRTLEMLGYTWDGGKFWRPPVAHSKPAPRADKFESIAVMVLIETNDPRVLPDTLKMSTPREVALLRNAVLENLPRLTRVVAVLDEDSARLMCAAHSVAAAMSGLDAIRRPPESYSAPNDKVPPFFP